MADLNTYDPSLIVPNANSSDTAPDNSSASDAGAPPSFDDLSRQYYARYLQRQNPVSLPAGATVGDQANAIAQGGQLDFNTLAKSLYPGGNTDPASQHSSDTNNTLLDLGLRWMAASGKPGATAIGSLGEAGLGANADYKETLNKRAQATRDIFNMANTENNTSDNMLSKAGSMAYQGQELDLKSQANDIEAQKAVALAHEAMSKGDYYTGLLALKQAAQNGDGSGGKEPADVTKHKYYVNSFLAQGDDLVTANNKANDQISKQSDGNKMMTLAMQHHKDVLAAGGSTTPEKDVDYAKRAIAAMRETKGEGAVQGVDQGSGQSQNSMPPPGLLDELDKRKMGDQTLVNAARKTASGTTGVNSVDIDNLMKSTGTLPMTPIPQQSTASPATLSDVKPLKIDDSIENDDE